MNRFEDDGMEDFGKAILIAVVALFAVIVAVSLYFTV